MPAPGVDALPRELGMELLARRPDLQAARWRVEAQLGRVAASEAAFHPDINLAGALGLDAVSLGKLLRCPSRTPLLGATLDLPLFDSGRLQAQLGVARASRDELHGRVQRGRAGRRARSGRRKARPCRASTQEAQAHAATVDASRKLARERRGAHAGAAWPTAPPCCRRSQTLLRQQRHRPAAARTPRLQTQVALVKALGGGYHAHAVAPPPRTATHLDHDTKSSETTTMSTETTQAPNKGKRRVVLAGITAAFLAAGAAYGAYYVLVASKRAETDNAYVGGNLVNVSSQVTGSVVEIRADETQLVQAGAEIVTPRPVRRRGRAGPGRGAPGHRRAPAARALLQRRAVRTPLVDQRRVELKAAQDDLARRLPLAADNVVSGEDVAHARRAVDDAKAALDVAQKQVAAARVAVAGVAPAEHPNVLAAKADYLSAWLAARRNAIVAPVSGYVAKRSVQVGSRIAPGAPLLSIVPLDQLWVDANFKESELRDIRVGQPATIEADIYGSKVVYHGKVVGLAAGTGSAFSLLPAQNATGNWIKVVQRVPVRISLDPKELAAAPAARGPVGHRRRRHQPAGRRRARHRGGAGAGAMRPLC